jgi:histone acetyltransferase
LNEAKNVFNRRLLNIGPAYIARLVFDLRGESVVMLHEGVVHGGISHRIFWDEKFTEIAFLAVDSALARKGYGRVLMQYLKTVLQSVEIYDILTCADNQALQYFKKQGFNDRDIMMDPQRYVGRLKEYTQVTLVHCQIVPHMDYIRFATIFEEIIKFTEARIGTHCRPPIFDKSLIWTPTPQSPTFVSMPLPELIRRTELGVRGEAEKRKMADYNKRMAELRGKCLRILEQLQEDPEIADLFQRPVTEIVAPGYFSRISRPMDLQTIERRLKRFPDFYKRPSVFAADVMLMVENCKTYNDAETPYYRIAVHTQKKFRALFRAEFPGAVMVDD